MGLIFRRDVAAQPKPPIAVRVRSRWSPGRNWVLHVMVLPALILTVLFSYFPMMGIIMAFQEFKPWLGFGNSPWVGLTHFETLLAFPETRQVIVNTLVISILKIIFNILVPLVFALLLNEVRFGLFKRAVQTVTYLPHFLSWVMLGAILTDMLSIDGIINSTLVSLFGIEPIFFLGKSDWFLGTIVASDVWKNYGFSTIIYLAALTGIDATLYEASAIDGASRWQQTIYISIPSILPILIVVATLSLASILNGGFDQIYNLYNPLVYDVGDIIDTYVYRIGLLSGRYSFAAAVGLFKSVVGFVLIFISYRLAYKYAGYRVF